MGMRGLATAVSRWLRGPDFGHDNDGAMHWAESAEQLAIAEEQREVWEPFGECEQHWCPKNVCFPYHEVEP